MTINEALKNYHDIEIELLLAHVLKKPKEFLFMNPEFKITTKQYNNLTKLIKRRQKGEPIAYILGYKDFYGLKFKVNKDVLIPRPETEMVMDTVIERLGDTAKILDVGTGSGCIIISLAKKLQETGDKFEFYASDISEKSLKVAKDNAKAHRIKIKFIKSDLLDNIKFIPNVIIANLPYGWSEWKNNTSVETRDLKFEPKQALFAKEHGLYQIRRLLEQIAQREQKPKLIYLEFDPRQKAELAGLIKKYLPGGDTRFHKDFGGLWRYAEINP